MKPCQYHPRQKEKWNPLRVGYRFALLNLWLCLGMCAAVPAQGLSQVQDVRNLYGTWENTGSFRDGKQQLAALQDKVQNSRTYYFTFFRDGTFEYDVISLKAGLKDSRRKGKWQLSPNGQRITLIDEKVNPEKRSVPADFLNFKTDGSLFTKPMIFPVLELTPKKLVLFDEYHKTLDIFRKE